MVTLVKGVCYFICGYVLVMLGDMTAASDTLGQFESRGLVVAGWALVVCGLVLVFLAVVGALAPMLVRWWKARRKDA